MQKAVEVVVEVQVEEAAVAEQNRNHPLNLQPNPP
jgi:hypothetical protein